MSSSMKIGFYQKGLKVWISNPYPADDENHFKKALPNSTRPLFVPAQVESKTVRGPTLAAALPPLRHTCSCARLSTPVCACACTAMRWLPLCSHRRPLGFCSDRRTK